MFRAPPPERRSRRDLVAAGVIAAVLAALVVTVSVTSDVAGTTDRVAEVPIEIPPPASGAPVAFAQAWEAASPGTPVPVVAGPAVVTADGSTVSGRDARTGEERWSYARDLPLCTVGAGFPGVEAGRVLAVYANGEDPGAGDGTYCSEVTMLQGDTGARVGARNPDARPGTRLLADQTYVLATGTDHLEVWRSDLVRTLEYGVVPAQEQVGRQPRPGCTHGSTALGGRRVAVLERCPDDATDRLTVLAADGADGAEKPEEEFSVLLPGSGAAVVAVSDEQVAVALPDPARLVVYDAAGVQLSVSEVDGEVVDPPGGVVPTSADDSHRYWFTGSSVLALDAGQLALLWTFPDALGPPVRYGIDLLVPVEGGIRVLDPDRGTPERFLPVDRPDPGAPVVPAVDGDVLLEQRGDRVAALVPTP
ncbi:Rv3212 family protein [Pseudonocardia abyssalis]|uniref:Pyrroloquinoline-quinone binding quinoprotein n=1 Tax=Pseudonocardia abyssalis TaxID=2792008 RepID=A0ABS6UWQ1_9PSEU|nr:hypothetical protein [Pseudonocardia abyssalis]MBW0117549.1 hypothetical protein [Pseudonocardia abyssalis]MBW0136406.1 hypothetical protein [Pseudonocardia abyssalis]